MLFRSERLAAALREKKVDATTTRGSSQMGSGSLPAQNLPTTLVAITPEGIDAETLARRLRLHEPPVFARIQNEQVLLDPRTLRAGDDGILVEAVASAITASP